MMYPFFSFYLFPLAPAWVCLLDSLAVCTLFPTRPFFLIVRFLVGKGFNEAHLGPALSWVLVWSPRAFYFCILLYLLINQWYVANDW